MLTLTAHRSTVAVPAAPPVRRRRRPGTVESVGRHLVLFLAVVTTGMGAYTVVEGRAAPAATIDTSVPAVLAGPPAAPAPRR